MKRIFLLWIQLVDLITAYNAEIENSTENGASLNNTAVSTSDVNIKDFYHYLNRCPQFENVYLTQTELFNRLVNPCRYDKIQRPPQFDETGRSIPINVYIRAYVFYMQNLDTQNLQFTLQMRFQIRYFDQRLAFKTVVSNRTKPIVGEEDLRKELWTPHVFFVNEKSSGILGAQNRDVITTIHSDGTVFMSSRIQVSLYCSMNFKKFPLDQQHCKNTIGSWIYNSSDVKLKWEQNSPFTMGTDKILTEYTFLNVSLDEEEISAMTAGLQYGDFTGNYSSITFSIVLDRSLGFYLLDYYFPSMMLVVISWVSFWLQADQTAPRAMLGTSSMLTFITLSSSQTKTLPKVSYIKASEVWFISCALFIFGSLIEFAFVNLLWRRKKDMVLKEVTTVNILKKTLTPTLMRKTYHSTNGSALRKSFSMNSISKIDKDPPMEKIHYDRWLSVNTPVFACGSFDDINSNKSMDDIVIPVPMNAEINQEEKKKTTLSHKDIAILLDKRARLIFPCAFLVFNILYWIAVNV